MSARSEHRHRSRKERSRSRSPARSGDGEHRRHKESKESSRQKIPESKQIDAEKDYFLKQEEFRVWLRDEKGKVRFLGCGLWDGCADVLVYC